MKNGYLSNDFQIFDTTCAQKFYKEGLMMIRCSKEGLGQCYAVLRKGLGLCFTVLKKDFDYAIA